MEKVEHKNDVDELKSIIEEHVASTGSKRGKDILEHFDIYAPLFKKIIPLDYKVMLRNIAHFEEQGADSETAKIEAFRAFLEGGDR